VTTRLALLGCVLAFQACSGWTPPWEAAPVPPAQPAKGAGRPGKAHAPNATDVTDPAKLKAPAVRTPAARTFPDVIVITLDTTRADHLGTYGYLRDTSPRLDAFAATSIVFDRLVVPMATTLPTHTSLFTGVYPIEHGITANVEHGGLQFIPSDKLIPMAAWLSDAGYQTGGFTSSAPLNPQTGIERGFQVFTAPKGDLRPGKATTDDALGWLATTSPDVPMLMWVHYYDPHNPYAPDEKYHQEFLADARIEAWIDERQIERLTKRPTGEPVRARPTINQYDAEIRTMDDQFGRVLDALSARGKLDDALVIVMGDHGEGLNQHGEPGHGLVWDEQLHAPLFIKAPGAAPRRVAATTSAVDVLATALALVDLPDEASILAQSSGQNALSPDAVTRPALSQMSARQLQFGKQLTFALTDDRYKCTWVEGEPPKVWDLKEDPFELKNPPDPHPEQEAACKEQGEKIVAAQRARATELGAGKTQQMDPAQIQMLKDLGYLDGPGAKGDGDE
jgi:arylsulfatase A-like enzyme